MSPTPNTIDEYIAGYPAETQALLRQIRAVIQAAAPQASETIKYGMPTFVLHGNLVSFGAYKQHIGMYPRPDPGADEAFAQALQRYAGAKSTLRFPLNQPMPYDLITQVVKALVAGQAARHAARHKPK